LQRIQNNRSIKEDLRGGREIYPFFLIQILLII
jgi:hypothetical protein